MCRTFIRGRNCYNSHIESHIAYIGDGRAPKNPCGPPGHDASEHGRATTTHIRQHYTWNIYDCVCSLRVGNIYKRFVSPRSHCARLLVDDDDNYDVDDDDDDVGDDTNGGAYTHDEQVRAICREIDAVTSDWLCACMYLYTHRGKLLSQ